ncbi:MAG: hypothetical protein HOP19_06955 [Acidobacteria bacterium]|nr:hypothetical protein [Acidobacteriota bacterium]
MLSAVGIGVTYGLFARLVFDKRVSREYFEPMSFAFIFGVPVVLGFLTVYIGERENNWNWAERLFLPWVTAWLALFAALALGWEGIICVFLWGPLFMVLSSVGALLALFVREVLGTNKPNAFVLCSVAVLPFLITPIERQFTPPSQMRTVATQIEIASDVATVWRNIERVPAIQPAEHSFALSHLIGFPKPDEARLIGSGVGAIRHATFERGVLFIETITDWQPQQYLAFTIKADADKIPPTTLDQHVTVGGPYFDVLQGDYRIEPLANGRVRLHLGSTHRLSTRFNFYAGWWTDFIMRDTQNYILRIIKGRCETLPR